jgi:hypothetical protein
MSSLCHLTKQKFRNINAFLQNCPRYYDDDIELQTNKYAQKLMKQQVETLASLWECVRQHTNNAKDNRVQQDRSLCCVLWPNETGVHLVSCKHENKGIHKTGPCGQTTSTNDMQEIEPCQQTRLTKYMQEKE